MFGFEVLDTHLALEQKAHQTLTKRDETGSCETNP